MIKTVMQYILHNQVILALLLVVLGLLLFQIKEILITIFVSYIIMAGLSSVVNALKKRGVPWLLSVVLTYISLVLLLVLIIFPIVPFFIQQLGQLFTHLPEYIKAAIKVSGLSIEANDINSFATSEFGLIGRNAIDLTGKVFGGFFSTLSVMVISFYLLIDQQRIRENFTNIFPKNKQQRILLLFSHIDEKLGAWVRGQILLSLSIGIIIWITLTILGLPFAIPLAVLAGLLEIIPTLGPIISAIPAAIVALSISPQLMVITISLYIVVQWLENHILVPKIMEKVVGLHPIVIIVSVMVGAKLMGVIGALLAVPFISLITLFIKELKKENI